MQSATERSIPVPLTPSGDGYARLYDWSEEFASGDPITRSDHDEHDGDLEAAIDTIAGRLASVERSSVASVASATTTSIAATLGWVRADGYATSGDGGAAIYQRVASEPAHPGKFKSADGAWWEIDAAILQSRLFGGSVATAKAVALAQSRPLLLTGAEDVVVSVGVGGDFATLAAAIDGTEHWISGSFRRIIFQYVAGLTQDPSAITLSRSIRIRGYESSGSAYVGLTASAVAFSGERGNYTATITVSSTASCYVGQMLWFDSIVENNDLNALLGCYRISSINTGANTVTVALKDQRESLTAPTGAISMTLLAFHSTLECTTALGAAGSEAYLMLEPGNTVAVKNLMMWTALFHTEANGSNAFLVRDNATLDVEAYLGMHGFLRTGVWVIGGNLLASYISATGGKKGLHFQSNGVGNVIRFRGGSMSQLAVGATDQSTLTITASHYVGSAGAIHCSDQAKVITPSASIIGCKRGVECYDGRVEMQGTAMIDCETGIFGYGPDCVFEVASNTTVDDASWGMQIYNGALVDAIGGAITFTNSVNYDTNVLPNIKDASGSTYRVGGSAYVIEALKELTIANDSVLSYAVTNTGNGGKVSFINSNATSGFAQDHFEVWLNSEVTSLDDKYSGASVVSQGQRVIYVGDGPLTGTSGPDGFVNVAVSYVDGQIRLYVENRRGGTRNYSVHPVGVRLEDF